MHGGMSVRCARRLLIAPGLGGPGAAPLASLEGGASRGLQDGTPAPAGAHPRPCTRGVHSLAHGMPFAARPGLPSQGSGMVWGWAAGGLRSYGKPMRRKDEEEPDTTPKYKVNRFITSPTVRLITDEGQEVVTLAQALKAARMADLDLVEVDSRGKPPACRLLDYAKFAYQSKVKESTARKKLMEVRRAGQKKEIKFTTRVAAHDLNMKVNSIRKFLTKGHRVRVVVAIPEGKASQGDIDVARARELCEDVAERTHDISKLDRPHKQTNSVRYIMDLVAVAPKVKGKDKGAVGGEGAGESQGDSDSESEGGSDEDEEEDEGDEEEGGKGVKGT